MHRHKLLQQTGSSTPGRASRCGQGPTGRMQFGATQAAASPAACEITVAVRVRPVLPKEAAQGSRSVLSVEGMQMCKLVDPSFGGAAMAAATAAGGLDEGPQAIWSRTFAYDRVYDYDTVPPDEVASIGKSQEDVYNEVGVKLLHQAWGGLNGTIFAYGQTGSGKTFTMMGGSVVDEDRGLVPRICQSLFLQVEAARAATAQSAVPGTQLILSVEVSYFEVYNEAVRDLFDQGGKKIGLRVREDPVDGAYIEKLTWVEVGNYSEIEQLLDYGGRARTVASTNMNESSSRSHAIFTVNFSQQLVQPRSTGGPPKVVERTSRINLVDLAGSERVSYTGATGQQLKEAGSINKSLATLGDVIRALSSRTKASFVPYRNSVLTRLLKDSLGGNARTVMLACVSPCDIHFEETLSTLRYAERAKYVRTHARVNEESNEALVDKLLGEIAELRSQLAEREVVRYEQLESELSRLQSQLARKNSLIEQMGLPTSTAEGNRGAEYALVGDEVDKSLPRLVNLNQDPLFSECLAYYIREGATLVGSGESADIQLSADDILHRHAVLTHTHGMVHLSPLEEADVYVNGARLSCGTSAQTVLLNHRSRIVFGRHHVLRFDSPHSMLVTTAAGGLLEVGAPGQEDGERDTLLVVDWAFAQHELLLQNPQLTPQGMGRHLHIASPSHLLPKGRQELEPGTALNAAWAHVQELQRALAERDDAIELLKRQMTDLRQKTQPVSVSMSRKETPPTPISVPDSSSNVQIDVAAARARLEAMHNRLSTTMT